MFSTSRRDERRRLGAGPHEAGHARRVADGTPRVVVEVAAHEQVAREDLLLDGDLLAALELVHVLHRDDDLEDPVLEPTGGHDVAHVGAHLVLVTRVGVHDVPAAGAVVGTLDLDDLSSSSSSWPHPPSSTGSSLAEAPLPVASSTRSGSSLAAGDAATSSVSVVSSTASSTISSATSSATSSEASTVTASAISSTTASEAASSATASATSSSSALARASSAWVCDISVMGATS